QVNRLAHIRLQFERVCFDRPRANRFGWTFLAIADSACGFPEVKTSDPLVITKYNNCLTK
ncbi:MAG TPA: hypothetical protein V6C50_01475, partial [Crinalium sp.]